VQFHDSTGSLLSSAVGTGGPAFNTTPFATYFGAPIDPSFNNLQGQVTADLNGDGAPDLLIYGIVDNGTSSNPVRVQSFISNGKGGFTAGTPQHLALPATTSANGDTPTLPAIDVNGDGKLDLLIGTAVAYGNGDGTFQQPVTPAFLSSGFVGTYAADVTGDGKPDIIAVNAIPLFSLGQAPNIPLEVTVFANQGSGNFRSLGAFTLGTGHYSGSATLASLSFVDLNGDGKPDLVAQMYFIGVGNAEAPATIATSLNNGDGTFATAQPVSYTAIQNGVYIELLSLQAADFNRDGKVDLALIYPPPAEIPNLTYLSRIIFLPGNGDGTFGAEIDSTVSTMQQAGAVSAQPPAGNAVVTDANSDGAPDLVFGSGAVALGDGKGDFSSGTPVVEVAIPSGSAAINYVNAVSLGSIQPAGSSYPNLIFAAPPGGSAPFPLVAIPNSPAFTVQSGGGSLTVSVTSGQNASAALSVTGAPGYTGSVTLTCTGLPSGASCSFNPATLSLAGATPQSSMLTVSTAPGNMAGMVPFPGPGLATLSCGFLGGGLLLFWPKRRRAYWMMFALAGVALLPLGCGGNSSSTSKSNVTPAGTYNFQVIATAGTTQTATSCTLIVQ
jgi:hypothetical protein